jgi:CRISPR-associated endonuclease Csn1
VVKKPLSTINLATLDKMFGKERDYKLYNALKERLQQYDDDPKKAFAEPFFKPTNDGSQGPLVRGIKIMESGCSGVLVNHGIADNANGGMIRIDIFTKGNKFYIIPIYVADRLKDELPKYAIVANKDEPDWDLIDQTYAFCFSLYPNDLVKVEVKDRVIFGYYRGCDRSTGKITIEAHDWYAPI